MTAWETTRKPKMMGLAKVDLTFDLALIGGSCEKHARQFSDSKGNVWVVVAVYKPEDSPQKLDLKPLAKPKAVMKRKEYWYKKVVAK